jgi:hypothetical protein
MPSTQTLYRAAMLPGNDLGNRTAETQLPDGRNVPLVLPLPSNGTLVNKSFRLRMYGRVAASINNSYTIQVYFGFDPIITNNLLIFSTGAQIVPAVKSNYELWLDLTWDNDSKAINGRVTGQLANNLIGPASLLNVPTAVDPNRDSNTFLQSGPTYAFTATGKFAIGHLNNHAFVDLMNLEEV